MEYAVKNNKNDSKANGNRIDVGESKHSLVKNKINGILRGGDQEQAAKQAASEAISAGNDNPSVADNNQSISQRSQIRDILAGASPTSIPDNVRSNIEDKYNADFSSVRFYQDAESTKAVNAKAYTYGSDIVFSPKYYQPNTTEGKMLIAHELAHVVQQNQNGTIQLQRDKLKQSEIPKDKIFEFNDSLHEIMPPETGLLHDIMITGILLDTFKDPLFIASLTRRIAADTAATAFTKSHGICGLMALFDANVDVKKAQQLIDKNKGYYTLDSIMKRSKNSPEDGIKKDLLEVSSDSEKSAKGEDSYSNISNKDIQANWALTLSKENLSNLKKVVPALKMVKAHGENGQARYTSSKDSLSKAEDKMTECRKSYSKAVSRKYGDAQAQYMIKDIVALLSEARDSLGLASAYGISKLTGFYGDIKKEMDKLQSIFSEWKQHREKQKESGSTNTKMYKLDVSKFNDIKDNVVKTRRTLQDDNYKYEGGGKSVKRIEFIIRYFIMLNDKTYKNAPTLDESRGFLNTLYNLPGDFKKVFGDKSSFDSTIYTELIKIIPKQIKARTLIEKQSGKDPGVKINRASIEAHFKALKKQPNESIVEAYQAYAGGFFQHRKEAPKERVTAPTIDEVYANPVTIGGARMIVCAGYAELAMELFKLAGATPKGFIIWGEFTDGEILAELPEYTTLHIITKVKRKNETFYISNDEVYPTAESAFKGVGYENNPTNGKNSIKSKGNTAKDADKNFIKEFQKKRKKSYKEDKEIANCSDR